MFCNCDSFLYVQELNGIHSQVCHVEVGCNTSFAAQNDKIHHQSKLFIIFVAKLNNHRYNIYVLFNTMKVLNPGESMSVFG